MEIKRVTENERTSEFINVEFTNYATGIQGTTKQVLRKMRKGKNE